MSMCRVFSFVVGRECLQWPVHSLGKTLLAFALLHSVFQGQICLLLQVFLDLLLLYSSPYNEKGIFFWVLFLEGLVSLHRTVQLQTSSNNASSKYYWLGHRFGLLCYWIVCLGNEQRLFCHFWYCTQVLHFRLFLLTKMATPFLLRILAHSSRYNGYLIQIHPFQSILVCWFLKCQCSVLPSLFDHF